MWQIERQKNKETERPKIRPGQRETECHRGDKERQNVTEGTERERDDKQCQSLGVLKAQV